VRRGAISAGAVVLAALVSGCGSSGHNAASTNASTASAPASPSSQAAIPADAPPAVRELAGRMLVAGDLPRFSPRGKRIVGINSSSWVAALGLPPSEREKSLRTLDRLGFVRGVREQLTPSPETGPEAISIAIKFRSPQSALAYVQQELKSGQTHGAKPFAVPGIADAKGFGGSFGAIVGYNVAFANRNFYYLVGEGYPTGAPGAPTRQELVTAAQRLDARVGH
jgi:hypothetical protein